ncbi:MAG: hypothetical protein HFP81_07900 [Methylococcales symbiont of Hymedesmia sp. n. MRB-2018]|nr:MAG: hypothetical protein HFP78_08135 [Methylococcales symbiont of Hymedesmia sp. n. MRB-2018]KAF3983283.1 MAG: hypothetical protein HFP81_07900 [Methylococcales symbiont of Hymedesmia sp. n. MRB-2018]
MNSQHIESYIQKSDKLALYRLHMEGKINDEELFDAIIKIDNSVKSKKPGYGKLVHNILFPSAAEH